MSFFLSFFFFNDTATTEIYTLSLHDALPIFVGALGKELRGVGQAERADESPVQPGHRDLGRRGRRSDRGRVGRSEEHTSELQSRRDLVCRLLLEKKKKKE